VAALDRLLDDLAALLIDLPEEAYLATPLPGVSGSIGGHVRHTLDHIAAFAGGGPSTTLNYDRRERGTAVERDPSAALRTILRLKASLVSRRLDGLDQPVQVASMIASSGESVTGWSTLARELAFVVSHTVHHQAIIALLLAVQGLGAPAWFGYAPSTPRPSAS
jgi:uncharacterized damage-inducible protein DinB